MAAAIFFLDRHGDFEFFLRFATHLAALSSFQSLGRITRDKRKIARLTIFPNLHYKNFF